MKKPIILLLYGVALFFILRRYYKTNSGLPTPTVLAAPTYLYGIGLLVSDFGGGIPVVIMAGLTLGLIWRSESASNQPATAPTTANGGAIQGSMPGAKTPQNPTGKNTAIPANPNGPTLDPKTGLPVNPYAPNTPPVQA